MTTTAMASETPVPITDIQPRAAWRAGWLRELWTYRELAGFLVWRDITVRYKQTAIGVAWAVLQPLALMVVFTLFFGTLAQIPSEGIPYPLFAYAGLLPWQIFARSMTESASSLVADQRLVTKVYFPRLLIPLTPVGAALVDFAIASVLLVVLMVGYRVPLSPNVLWLPVFLALMIITALGIGAWLSALNLQYRDVRYTLPFLTQLWLFLTPVVYPSRLVPAEWGVLYGCNPMVVVVEGVRWALFGAGQPPSSLMLGVSGAMALVLFVSGIWFFRSRERIFADVLGSGGR